MQEITKDDGTMLRQFFSSQDRMLEAKLRALRDASVVKIKEQELGYNTQCPCGSGKRFKFCCINKIDGPAEKITDAQRYIESK